MPDSQDSGPPAEANPPSSRPSPAEDNPPESTSAEDPGEFHAIEDLASPSPTTYPILNLCLNLNRRLTDDVPPTGADKPSRPLEEDGSASPHAAKRRRTEAGAEELPSPSQPGAAADQTPGNLIEQELASALGTGPADDGQIKVENAAPEPTSELDPDVATVLSNIMNHAERVEEQCALGQQQLTDNTDQPTPDDVMILKANSHLKTQSLPILDNLVRSLRRVAAFQFKAYECLPSLPKSYPCLQSPASRTLLPSRLNHSLSTARLMPQCARCLTIPRRCTQPKAPSCLRPTLASRTRLKSTSFGRQIWPRSSRVSLGPRRLGLPS